MTTWLTPLRMLTRWPTCVLARSYNCPTVMLSLLSAAYKMGWSFGLVFANVGGEGKSIGSDQVDRLIAACTSVAAASMLLSSANCSMRLQKPCVLLLVTS